MRDARDRRLLAEHLRNPPAEADLPERSVLISIKPKYAELIERGEKRVEFRRRFPRSFRAGRAIFYITAPVSRIALTAEVVRVERGTPEAIWQRFSKAGGTTRKDFDTYFQASALAVALVLEDVVGLVPPIELNDPRLRAMNFRPPQSPAVVGDLELLELISSII